MPRSQLPRLPRRLLPALLLLLLAIPASGVTVDWVTVGAPGNACDRHTAYWCWGAVDTTYRIGRTEVTNAQYVEFLNAVGADDPNGVYATGMGGAYGGIVRSGTPGGYVYSVKAGYDPLPVNHVSFWSALRFANWMHNGQPTGAQSASTTEDGAYTLTPAGIAANSVMRNPGATIFLPSDDEWYKAAYYDPVSASYFDYPTGSDVPTTCADPGPAPNTANCERSWGTIFPVGSYPGSPSPFGTFDQGGNVNEWDEESNREWRLIRGGSFALTEYDLFAGFVQAVEPELESAAIGFRLAAVPEPGASWLLAVALLGLGRRARLERVALSR